jgi:FeS assembly protein IscX
VSEKQEKKKNEQGAAEDAEFRGRRKGNRSRSRRRETGQGRAGGARRNGMKKELDWTDVRRIAEALEEAHPGVDILKLRFTELHRWVTELEGFRGDPKASNEKTLEAIQMAWLDERD